MKRNRIKQKRIMFVVVVALMILSVFAFYAIYLAMEGSLGIQSLWIGYAAHLVTRSAAQTWMARKYIFNVI